MSEYKEYKIVAKEVTSVVSKNVRERAGFVVGTNATISML